MRSTIAYAGSAPAEPACGITINGLSGQEKYACAVCITTEPVPVTSKAVGFSVASAAHRSHAIVVAPPPPPLPAIVMFDSVNPYEGFGRITTAAIASGTAPVIVIGYTVVIVTPASRLPPGDAVVSTSTTTELSVCGGALGVGDGEKDGVPEPDRVAVRETVLDAVSDGETDGVAVTEGVIAGVPLTVGDTDGVGLCDGLNEGVTERVGVPVRDDDRESVPLREAVGDGVAARDGDREGVPEKDGVRDAVSGVEAVALDVDGRLEVAVDEAIDDEVASAAVAVDESVAEAVVVDAALAPAVALAAGEVDAHGAYAGDATAASPEQTILRMWWPSASAAPRFTVESGKKTAPSDGRTAGSMGP